MELDLRLFTTTVVAIINVLGIGLIFLSYSSKSKDRPTKIFIQMTLIMLVWVNFAYLARIPEQGNLSLLWIRIAWALTPFLFVLIYFFAKSFTRKNIDKNTKIALLGIGLIYLVITLFTNLIIKDVSLDPYGTLQIIYGNFILSYFGIVFLLTILGASVLLKKLYSTQNKEEKKKIKYILTGIVFFLAMNSVFNIYLPYFKNTFHLYFLGDYSVSIFLSFLAYATIKHGLFNTKIFAAEVLVFLFWVTFSLKLFWSSTSFDRGLNLFLFIFSIIFGVFLIKSIKKEIEQRERLERLAFELENANVELKRMDKSKSEFVSIASHQLRTPLTAIKGYLSMVTDGTYGKVPPKIREKMKNVFESNERLIRLVNELLSLSRIETGKIKLEPEKLNLQDIVKQVIDDLRIVSKKNGLYLRLSKPKKKLPEMMIDEWKIRQVLINLVDNALKYTVKGGVAITIKREENNAKIEICDTGEGMDEEELEKMFESFSRGKAGNRLSSEGSGLGLYIARKFVEMHEGKIWAESEGKGKGSCFHILLPIR